MIFESPNPYKTSLFLSLCDHLKKLKIEQDGHPFDDTKNANEASKNQKTQKEPVDLVEEQQNLVTSQNVNDD